MARGAVPLLVLLVLGTATLANAGLWDLEGRFACGSIQLYGIDFFDDLTFNPSTNTMWVTARGGLLEYDLSGKIIRKIPGRALRSAGLAVVTGVKWVEGSYLLISHREEAVVSVIDTSGEGFGVVASMPVTKPGSTALAAIPGGSGILIVYPSNLTEVYRADKAEGEARFFTGQAPANSIDYTSVHFAPDQGKLLALSRTVGRFPGSITEIDASGNYVAYPLWDLVDGLVPKALEFLPSGSVMFLAGKNRDVGLAEVQFYCAADVRGTPGMFRSTVWEPIISCVPGQCGRGSAGTADPASLGFDADIIKSPEQLTSRGTEDVGNAMLGGNGTPEWLQQWFSVPNSQRATTAAVAPGGYVFYPGYGYRWEV